MRTTLLAASLALAVLVPTTHVAAQSAQDKAIAQEIGGQLKSSGQLRDYRIGVKYKDGIDQVVNNLTIASSNPGLTKPATQLAARASYAGPGPQNAAATRTSYQQGGGQQPMVRQGMNGQAMNRQKMGPMGQ